MPGRGKWLGRVPAEPPGYYIWSSHFHGTVIKKRTLTKKISCLSSCRSEAISKKWSKVMEGLSKMKRQDCSGTIQGLIGQQNVANSLEGCSKMGVPGIHELCRTCRTCKNLRELAELASGIEPPPAARSHPSSRAGGQDDVSYTNSLKLIWVRG